MSRKGLERGRKEPKAAAMEREAFRKAMERGKANAEYGKTMEVKEWRKQKKKQRQKQTKEGKERQRERERLRTHNKILV